VIIQLGLKYAQGIITGSNARCVAMLEAFKVVIQDFTPPTGNLFRDFDIKPLVQFIVDCRPLSISMGNAINYLKLVMLATKKLGEQEVITFISLVCFFSQSLA
jgi:translation initiation factor eIF-2B subunit delta